MIDTPNFIGQKCVILHRPGEVVNVLARQLGLLGMTVHAQWEALDLAATPADVVIVDADAGWPGLLPWLSGSPQVPLIALLASEAPSRIKWALEVGAAAIIAKPVAASAVYPALVMGYHAHAKALQQAQAVAILQERLRLRPLVEAAVQLLMQEHDLGEEAAHRRLRQEAMQSRQPLEVLAAAIVSARGKVAS